MKNLPLLIGTIVGTLILVVVVAFAFSNSAAQPEVDTSLLTENAVHIKGAENPTVTVVEFSDLQCPACRAAAPLTDQLVAQYPDQVQVVMRHYPLTQIHPLAQTAAQAAVAADQDGKFWEMRDLIFANQTEWSGQSPEEFTEILGAYADQLEIDKTAFLERIESPEVKEVVARDVQLGNQVQIQGTPTFFVNGQRTPAPQLLDTVESLLNT